MIFIAERRGKPKGSKNKPKEDISMPDELSKEEQRVFDISSVFAQKGFFNFDVGGIDNERVIESEDQELISLYNELVSIVTNNPKAMTSKVLFKIYDTFSNRETLNRAVDFMSFAISKGYEGNTVDDLNVPNSEVEKLQKDFESLPPKPEPTVSKSSSDERDSITGRKKYTKRTPEQNKQDVVMGLTKYLKDVLKLSDDEIKSRVDSLLGPTQTSNDDEETSSSNDNGYWGDSTTTLNEQILKDFKRFL